MSEFGFHFGDQRKGHIEKGPRFKVPSETPEKRESEPAIPLLDKLVVWSRYPQDYRRSFIRQSGKTEKLLSFVEMAKKHAVVPYTSSCMYKILCIGCHFYKGNNLESCSFLYAYTVICILNKFILNKDICI